MTGKTGFLIHCNFLYFFTHIKSSSSTTSRELRQQFAACSGEDDKVKFRLESVILFTFQIGREQLEKELQESTREESLYYNKGL